MNDAELELEREKLELERERMNATIALQARESEIRERERRSEWLKGITPAVATLMVGLVGGLLALFQAQSQSAQQLHLEQIKARNGLILQAMQTGDVKQASKNLLFLAKNGIIDLDITKLEQSLEKYQPALPSMSETPYSRYLIPENLAETETFQISSVKIPASATTVKTGKFISRFGEPVVGIVVHNALGPEAVVNYLREGPGHSSLHWIVLPSGEIVPLVNEEMAAMHIGRSQKSGWTNRTTIGVAVAGEAPLSSPEQAASLYSLLANICKRRHLPVNAILSHNAVDPRKKDIPEQHMNQIRERVAKILAQWKSEVSP